MLSGDDRESELRQHGLTPVASDALCGGPHCEGKARLGLHAQPKDRILTTACTTLQAMSLGMALEQAYGLRAHNELDGLQGELGHRPPVLCL